MTMMVNHARMNKVTQGVLYHKTLHLDIVIRDAAFDLSLHIEISSPTFEEKVPADRMTESSN